MKNINEIDNFIWYVKDGKVINNQKQEQTNTKGKL